MVLFDNITNNQRVEVLRGNEVYRGIVRYKGILNSIPGDWVGVDLDKPVGQHDGMLQGRRYFQCRPKHGIFVTARNIRFIPMNRCLYDNYRLLRKQSHADETLFHPAQRNAARAEEDVCLEQEYMREYLLKSDYLRYSSVFDLPVKETQYRLSHPVGNHIPAATMRPWTARERSKYSPDMGRRSRYSPEPAVLGPRTAKDVPRYSPEPLYPDYGLIEEDWITSPSIPVTHMPYSVEKREVKKGWGTAPIPRYHLLHTANDSIRKSFMDLE